jgi:glycosyltransferase involved in cell wall biosynthesis
MAETMKSILPESKTTILRSPGITKPKNQSINKERNDWLYAGRLTPEKGILNIINSWPREENLDIAGDGPLLSEIKNIISSKPNIKLIGLYPPGDTSIYSKYKGLIFGSTWYEGSPLVVADCLSTGTPVICTDESGASELIDISKGGFVIKGKLNEIKIKNAIIDIRKNFKLYSDNAIKSSFTEFSVENWASKLETIIYSVLK